MIITQFTNQEIAELRQKVKAPLDCDNCGREIVEGDKYFFLEGEIRSSGSQVLVSMQCEGCVRTSLPRLPIVAPVES